MNGLNTGLSNFIALCSYSLFFFLNKSKVCGNSLGHKSVGAIFPTGPDDG